MTAIAIHFQNARSSGADIAPLGEKRPTRQMTIKDRHMFGIRVSTLNYAILCI